MNNRFSQFPKRLQKKLEQLEERMLDDRKEFKEIIREGYRKKPPFTETLVNHEKIAKQFIDLIGYCVIAGDTDLLEEWGVSFFKKQKRFARISTDDIEIYLRAFSDYKSKKARGKLEQQCADIVCEMFHTLA